MSTKEQKVKVDADYSLMPVPGHARRNIVTMFMIMLGFTFFSASMWTGQELGAGLDLSGFIGSLLLGGIILGIYTALLAYVGCKTGLSMDLLAQHSFGKKGSYLPSALISFTQIGWFGVGVAMFAIPVARLLAPDKPWMVPLLVAVAGICMTGSAFFGIRAMTIVSYISVPLIAMLGIEHHNRSGNGYRLLRQRRYGHPQLRPFCKDTESGCLDNHHRLFPGEQPDVLLRRIQRCVCGRK